MKGTTDTPKEGKSGQTEKVEHVRRAVTEAADLVRVETTLDTQPIWAPSSYAAELKRVYPLPWRGEKASVTVQSSGEYGMLRSFDKLVLTALVHLWNGQGRQEQGRVYFQVIDLIHALGRRDDGRTYGLIKDSLHRLRGCLVQYQLSFFDADAEEWVTLRDKTILSDLLIVEPRRDSEDAVQMAMEALTYAVLDFQVVANLIGNFTRPVSLRLLQGLTERGVLFESYVNAVLYRNRTVRKDIYELWHDLGLSTAGINYGSQLASRMRKDLDKIAADDTSLLGAYRLEKSKTRARSQNLVLQRSKGADLTAPSTKYRTSDEPRERYQLAKGADLDKLVQWMRFELHDQSDNDANLRLIAARMPKDLITRTVDEAYGRYRDGLVNNPTAYFVAVIKREARERGIDLGLPERDPSKPTATPKRVELRDHTRGLSSVQELTAELGRRLQQDDD